MKMNLQALSRYRGILAIMLVTILLFWFMSLAVFVVLCLALVIRIALVDFPVDAATAQERNGRLLVRKVTYYMSIGIACVAGMFTISRYVAAPARIFKNADHHVIEHLGYEFAGKMKLVDEMSPQKALWDGKKGQLDLAYEADTKGFSLTGKRFYEPLFLKNDTSYVLANDQLSGSFKNTFTVEFSRKRKVTVSVNDLNSKKPVYQYAYADKDSAYPLLTINFDKTIRTGISLRDLIGITPEFAEGFEQVLAMMEGTYIVRQNYLIKGNDRLNDSPMHLFPSRIWADSVVSLQIDGLPVRLNKKFAFSLPLTQGQLFYTGLRTKRTKNYLVRGGQDGAGLYLGFPERKYFKSSEKDEETIFVTSSSSRVSETDFSSVLLFDGPSREDNVNHFTTGITYGTGSTSEEMLFRVVNEVQDDDLSGNSALKIVTAGDTVQLKTALSKDTGHGVSWIMSVRDMKSSNGLPLWLLMGYIIGFAFLALFSIWLTPLDRIKNSFRVEVAAYITLLAFMVVRSVLLWRATTFVPLDDVAAIDYDTLRGLKEHFWYQLYFTLGFFGVIFLYKVLIFKYKIWSSSGSAEKNGAQKSSPALYLLFLLYGMVALKGIGSIERVVSVLGPLATYFLIDFLFRRREAAKYGYATKSKEYVFLTKLNWLAAMAAFALGDAGFAIVFIIFSMIYWYLKIQVFPDHRLLSTQPRNQIFKAVWPYRSLFVALSIVGFIVCSPYILSFLFRNVIFAVEIILAGLVVVVWRDSFIPKKFKLGLAALIITGMALAVPFEQKIASLAQSKNRMLYRAEIRFKSADDIIAAEKFNLGNDRRLLNAAQNQWFIDYFYDKGEFNLIHYFKRVPHFQQGSSYLTQISDLVSVRYVIAEHSEVVLIGLILLFAFLTFLSVGKQIQFHSFNILRTQLLCFLFSLSFTIWLTASDRMVFVGQDFPMLSLNSLLTLIVGFGTLLVVILAGYGGPTPGELNAVANTFELKGGANFINRSLQLVFFIAVGSYALTQRNVNQFNLNQTISSLEDSFGRLNSVFAIYQKDVLPSQKSSKGGLRTLLGGFDAYLRAGSKDFFTNQTFQRSAYEAFLTRYVQSNSPEQLVHLRKNEDGIYEFAVNDFFYNVNSPDVYQNAWHGNLTSSSSRKSLSLASLKNPGTQINLDTNAVVAEFDELLQTRQILRKGQNLNIRLSMIPAGWTKDSLPGLIVGRTMGEERAARSAFLVKNGTELISSPQTRHAILLRANDVIHFKSLAENGAQGPVVSMKLNQRSYGYLAKNIWINGQRTHYYPLGERSLWSYYFANLVKSSYDKKPELWDKDLALTIDPGLTYRTYDRIEKYFANGVSSAKRGFSLVVMDSEGSIRALSDYKTDPKLRLNPNKMTDYDKLFEELYMDPARFNERNLFGNRCLVRMPNGPASTFKPILYGAITSQYNLGWQGLKFGGIGNYPLQVKGAKEDNLIRHFSGRKMRLVAARNNLDEHDNLFYLRNSTNTYNAMMVYLGSLTSSQMDQVADGFRRDTSTDFLKKGAHPEDPIFNFPLIKFNNRTYHVDKMPEWDENSSLMSQGLSDNFSMPMSLKAETDVVAADKRNLTLGLDNELINASRSSYKLWSLPESSHLYLIDRKKDTQNAVAQLAMGAYPLTVTPLKMAEMAVNLFSANSGIQASVLTQRKAGPTPHFTVAKNWAGDNNLLSFYSSNLFKAMHMAIDSGTAGFLRKSRTKDYTLYTKTGTISGDRSKEESRDKNLMVIISQNPLHDKKLTYDDMRKNKFYVLYFSFYSDASKGAWSEDAQQAIRDIIKDVQESGDFKNFMKKEKSAVGGKDLM